VCDRHPAPHSLLQAGPHGATWGSLWLQYIETLCEGRTAVFFLQQLRGGQVPLHIRIPDAHPRTSALTQAMLQGAWQRRGVPLFAHTPPGV